MIPVIPTPAEFIRPATSLHSWWTWKSILEVINGLKIAIFPDGGVVGVFCWFSRKSKSLFKQCFESFLKDGAKRALQKIWQD